MQICARRLKKEAYTIVPPFRGRSPYPSPMPSFWSPFNFNKDLEIRSQSQYKGSYTGLSSSVRVPLGRGYTPHAPPFLVTTPPARLIYSQ